MRRLRNVIICIVVLAAGLQPFARAQSVATSQINGTVQDTSGAAIPGAEIKVTRSDTGAVRTVISGEDGAYVIPSLAVGPYSLEVTLPGFAKFGQTGIVLEVATSRTIPVTLKVGDLTEDRLVV